MADVTDNKELQRYEMKVGDAVAIADYHMNGDRIAITHVEVPEELRGGGIAAQLMAGVVDNAKSRGLTIVPICSYAVSYLRRHPA